jgi:hypothetical protein
MTRYIERETMNSKRVLMATVASDNCKVIEAAATSGGVTGGQGSSQPCSIPTFVKTIARFVPGPGRAIGLPGFCNPSKWS